MGGRRTSLPAEISEVRARVERWRGEREGWSRMPGDLWEAAVELARSHGVSLVSRELRLDYTSLKKPPTPHPCPVRTPNPTFLCGVRAP